MGTQLDLAGHLSSWDAHWWRVAPLVVLGPDDPMGGEQHQAGRDDDNGLVVLIFLENFQFFRLFDKKASEISWGQEREEVLTPMIVLYFNAFH